MKRVDLYSAFGKQKENPTPPERSVGFARKRKYEDAIKKEMNVKVTESDKKNDLTKDQFAAWLDQRTIASYTTEQTSNGHTWWIEKK